MTALPPGLDRRHRWERHGTEGTEYVYICRSCRTMRRLNQLDVDLFSIYRPFLAELIEAKSTLLDVFA